MECIVCKCKQFNLIQNGTRDNEALDVYKCASCGTIQLSDFNHIDDDFYQESGMWNGNPVEVNKNPMDVLDDYRRAELLSSYCLNKSYLDFGCGTGGVLKHVSAYAKRTAGVEIEKKVVDNLKKNYGSVFQVEDDIDKYNESFDVISMFHVIEHLTDPMELLEKIKKHLKPGGEFIIETPNADDALISLYNCDAFKKFTFWSCHVVLYNSKSLETLLKNAGFKIKWSKQVQRYPISNHLYWLCNGKPGGQNVWNFLNSDIASMEYARMLEEKGICDTLMMCVTC